MTYTYGMKGAPAVGNGLPGLPRKGGAQGQRYMSISDPTSVPAQEIIYEYIPKGSYSGKIVIPNGFQFTRVTVVGRGGDSSSAFTAYDQKKSNGGGGGGCAGTNFYALNKKGAIVTFESPATYNGITGVLVRFMHYVMIAGNGENGSQSGGGGSGGGAYGGDVNHKGGSGARYSISIVHDGRGGGAAGRSENGYAPVSIASNQSSAAGKAGANEGFLWGFGPGGGWDAFTSGPRALTPPPIKTVPGTLITRYDDDRYRGASPGGGAGGSPLKTGGDGVVLVELW